MYPTVEVRWFLKGTVPESVWTWYGGWGIDLGEQPARVDHYLRIDDGDTLGIKLREGRIELKQRYGQRERVQFSDKAAGTVEQWRKWSFALADSEGVLAALGVGSSSWVGVRKERALRVFDVREGEIVVAMYGAVNMDRGCGWEVAKIRVERAEEGWWSVGFEAFGDEAEMRDTLIRVAEEVLSVSDAPVLGLENSYGYPRWLQRVGSLSFC